LPRAQLLGFQPFEAQLKEEQSPAASAQAQQALRHRAALVPPAARREELAQRAALAQSVAWVHLEVAPQKPAAPALQAEMCRVRLDNTHSRLTAALQAAVRATVRAACTRIQVAELRGSAVPVAVRM
jgi:hypothetical protein